MGSRGGQQECSVHGKMRSYINLIPDGTQGGMRCAPGMECKVAGVPNGGGLVCSAHGKTRSVDALVDDGKGGMRCGQHALCKVGTLCTVHGKLRNPDGMVDDGAGGMRCGPNALCKTGPQGGEDGEKNRKRVNLKRALCKYYEQGKCTKLDLCCFAHGEAELGQPIPEQALAMGPSQTNAATKWAASLGAASNNQFNSLGALEAMMGGGMDALAMMSAMGGMAGMGGLEAMGMAGMGMGAGMNAMDMFGGADMGKGGMPGMESWGEDWDSKASYGKVAGRGSTAQGVCMLHNKTRTMTCLVEQPDGTIICKATHECKVVPKLAPSAQGSPGQQKGGWNRKRNMCSFWQQGSCSKGDRCTYAHGEEELGQEIPADDWSRASPY